jgi:hypothetical protein
VHAYIYMYLYNIRDNMVQIHVYIHMHVYYFICHTTLYYNVLGLLYINQANTSRNKYIEKIKKETKKSIPQPRRRGEEH